MGAPTLALTGLSVLTSTLAARRNAQATRSAAEYNQSVAEQNQRLAEADADNQRIVGDRNIDARNQEIASALSSQLSALVGTGVDVNSGSALAIQQAGAAAGARDRVNFEEDLERQIYQTRLGAASSGSQAELFKSQAANASPSAATFGTLLGGATQFAESAYRYRSSFTEPELPVVHAPQANIYKE